MRINDKLESICDTLSKICLTDEQRIERFLQEYPKPKEMHDDHIRELLSELDTWMCWERITKEYDGVHIFFLPLNKEVKKGNFKFSRIKGRKPNIVIKKKDGSVLNELDLITLVDNQPVITETHIATYYNHGRNGTAQKLNRINIEYLRNPVEILGGINPAIVFRVASEQVRMSDITEPNPSHMYEFIKRGGYIVPFYTNRENWLQDAERMIKILKK